MGVPWNNPPSTPTLDWANGGADLPPEVSSAVGRFRMQAWNDRDRQVLTQFLVTNGDQLSAEEANALGDIIHAMSGPQVGAPSSGPSQALPQAPANLPTPTPPQISYVPGGGDIRSQVAAQAGAPASLPTPAPPGTPVPSSSVQIPLSPNDPAMLGSQGATPGLQQPQVASVRNPGILPTPTPSVPGSMPAGGYGASNIAARAARQAARGDARGAGTNWKGIEGLGANSAFADVQPQYLSAMANDPAMAARELAGPGHDITGNALEPLMGSALSMANLGLLGGGQGHGLGGPQSSIQQLQRAEGLINSLGPGQGIDPGYVLRKTVRRAGKTPIGDLYSGQGDPNDIMQQVATTQNAILASLKGVATDEAYNGTAAMLDQEANSWLQAVAHGEIDPNQISYPAWLREHKRQKYLGR